MQFLDLLLVGFRVLRVDLVLGGLGIKGAEFEENLYGSLILRNGYSLGALAFKLNGFLGVFYG